MEKKRIQEVPDIVVRLQPEKKFLKRELKKVAKRNKMSVNLLMMLMMEWFLDEIAKGKVFTREIK